MTLYWRENNLYTKQGERESDDDWTTFLFDMREPIEVINYINLLNLLNLLPKSLTILLFFIN
jgi:hypothetical protein